MVNEPLLTVASITALVAAVIALAVAFGFQMSQGQVEAIMGIVAVVAPIVVGLIARRHVIPTKKAIRRFEK